MKKIAATLLMSIAAAVTAPAHAQTPAPTAAQPAAGAAAVDPAAAAAVRELLVAMDYRNVVQQSFQQMTASMPALIKSSAEAGVRNNAKLTDEQKAQKLAEMEKRLPAITEAIGRMYADPALVDEMLDAMVPIYARHYTVAEMRELATFYKTPVGVKSLRLMPQLIGEGMQVGQQIMGPRMNKLLQELSKN